MEAKEVELRGKAIQKAQAEKSPPSDLISILTELRKEVVATENLLRSTKIGMTVGKLRAHQNPAIAKLANEVVGKWRTDVKKAGSGTSTPKPTNGAASPAPGGSTPSSKSQLASQTSEKAKHTVPKDKRNHKTDKVAWEVTGNQTRDNCIKLMYDGLAHNSEDLPGAIIKIARDVELAAYNKYQPETSQAYKDKFRSLYQNLKNKQNPGLRVRVLSGEVTPDRFVVMTHDELKSEDLRLKELALEKENLRRAMVAEGEKSLSGTIQCGKCKQWKVSYTQAQTRSADEPMTTFCECTNCGARWRM